MYNNLGKFCSWGTQMCHIRGSVRQQECSPPPQMHIQGLVRSQSAPLPRRCTSGVRSDHRVFPSPSELDHPSTPRTNFPLKQDLYLGLGGIFNLSCWMPFYLNCDCFLWKICMRMSYVVWGTLKIDPVWIGVAEFLKVHRLEGPEKPFPSFIRNMKYVIECTLSWPRVFTKTVSLPPHMKSITNLRLKIMAGRLHQC